MTDKDSMSTQMLVLQLDLTWHDRSANHAKARAMLESVKPQRGALVVLPEAFPVGFSMSVSEIADKAGETEAFVRKLAKDFAITVVAGNIVQPDERGRNVALAAGPDGHLLARYEKLHPFTFANEDQHYQAGSRLTPFTWAGAVVSPAICYDLRFPEIFRAGAAAGAEIFVVIANWPAARVHHWVSLLVARAIENQAYVIGCNRCGRDPNVAYPGRSIVIDPRGQIIADAGDQETTLPASLDLEDLRAYRKSFPALRDMRFVRSLEEK
ncbi:MAG TPA: carbon-nitrogen family hydrolase [Tepidisphaeraceae bacterium]|jgi:predicted amidohydrolase